MFKLEESMWTDRLRGIHDLTGGVYSEFAQSEILKAIRDVPGILHAEICEGEPGVLSVSFEASPFVRMVEIEHDLRSILPFEVETRGVECPSEEWLGTWVKNEGAPGEEEWYFVEWFEYVLPDKGASVWDWRVKTMSKATCDKNVYLTDGPERWGGPDAGWKRPRPWVRSKPKGPSVGWDPGY